MSENDRGGQIPIQDKTRVSGSRWCSGCNRAKPEVLFKRGKVIRSRCAECYRREDRMRGPKQARSRDREKDKENSRNYRRSEHGKMIRAAYRASAIGKLIGQRCYYKHKLKRTTDISKGDHIIMMIDQLNREITRIRKQMSSG